MVNHDISMSCFSYCLQVNEASDLSPGFFTLLTSERLNRKQKLEKAKEVSKHYKRRRAQLKSARSNKSSASTVREGDTYESGVDLQTTAPDTEEIPGGSVVDGQEPVVFFDLETTGLGRNADIVQIAAVSGEKKFSAYVRPSKPMTVEASRVTQIYVKGSKMYHKGTEVPCVTLKEALTGFTGFLGSLDGAPIVLGHNIARFDVPILYSSMQKVGLENMDVKGFVDTLSVASKLYKRGKDVSNMKQATLVSELLKETYDAHNAVADVVSLQKLYSLKLKPSCKLLQELLFQLCTHIYQSSSKVLAEQKIMSQSILSKMCKSGLGLVHLQLAYKRGGDEGVRAVLKEKVAGKVRVTSVAKTLDNITSFLSK